MPLVMGYLEEVSKKLCDFKIEKTVNKAGKGHLKADKEFYNRFVNLEEKLNLSKFDAHSGSLTRAHSQLTRGKKKLKRILNSKFKQNSSNFSLVDSTTRANSENPLKNSTSRLEKEFGNFSLVLDGDIYSQRDRRFLDLNKFRKLNKDMFKNRSKNQSFIINPTPAHERSRYGNSLGKVHKTSFK